MRNILALIAFALSFSSVNAQSVDGIVTNVTCPGGSNGSIDVTVNGGVPPFAYHWSTNANTQDLAGLTPGNYIVTVTGSNGGSAIKGFAVQQLSDTQPPSITCPANQTLATDANCSGAIGFWSPNFLSDNCTATGLIIVMQTPIASTVLSGHNDAEWVTLTATDASGNVANCGFTVTLKDVTAPSIACPANVVLNSAQNFCGAVFNYNQPCSDDNCGIQSVSIVSGFQSGSTFQVGTTANVWRATDMAGNTMTCYFTVTVNDIMPPTITCPASQTVTATANCMSQVFYGTPTATDNCSSPTISQQGGQSSGSTFSVGSTTNTFRATDVYGNTATCNFTVTVVGQQKSISSISASTPGTSVYNVTVTDICTGQVSTSTVLVTVPLCPPTSTCTLVAAAAPVSATCGQSNGSVNLAVAGGTSTYTYLWSNGTTLQNLNNVASGTYTVTVTNANCTTTTSVVVNCNQPVQNPPTASFTPSSYTGCAPLAVTFSNTSQNGLTYSWSFQNGSPSVSSAQNPGSVNFSSPGVYTITLTVTGLNGQQVTTTGYVLVNNCNPTCNLTVNASSNPASCNGCVDGTVGTSIVNGTMPYNYLWSNGVTSPSQANLPAGTYCVTVTDANGCTASACATVTQPAVPDCNPVGIENNLDYPFGWEGCPSTSQFFLTAPEDPANHTYVWSDPNLVLEPWRLFASTDEGPHHYWVRVYPGGVKYCFDYVVDCDGLLPTNGPQGSKIGLIVYPNPVADFVNAVVVDFHGEVSFDLYDSTGRSLKTRVSDCDGRLEERFDLTNFPAGIYSLNIKAGNRSVSKIVVKQ